MEILNQYSAYPESYLGSDGCLSILQQNCQSAEQTEFPFRFTINLSWSREDMDAAIARITDYVITFDAGVFTINKPAA